MNKLLISCPMCELAGRRNILGEIRDECLYILRFHNNYTKIRGEFEVICSVCDEPVYFKIGERNNEDSTFGKLRVSGLGTYQGTVAVA